jgi:hypothetical protein
VETTEVIVMIVALEPSFLLSLSLLLAPSGLSTRPRVPSPRLDPTTKLELINAQTKWLDYRGRRAIKLVALPGHEHAVNEEMQAILTESDFKDGTIEVDVAGARREGYSTAEDTSGFKGFIGVSFRVRGDSAERIYIRPENSRLDSQVFRNRSTQYEAEPGFAWDQLRAQSPGVYESYVDLDPGAWTRLRIEVSGTKARLYVNDATEPCLIVNDLKLGDGHGKIALWTRVSSEAYFSNLKVRGK